MTTIHADAALCDGEGTEARALRAALLDRLASSGDLLSLRVAQAMLAVPRHLFVPAGTGLRLAYANRPLPIGFEQTISQPAIVAVMTEALELTGAERVLEIGTGSGYQAAILDLLASEVYSIELVPELAETARARLAQLGYDHVHVRAGDGHAGWPEHAPFDRILLTAAPPALPPALLDQLADGGLLVSPVGQPRETQTLLRVRRLGADFTTEKLGPVRFVPMEYEARTAS